MSAQDPAVRHALRHGCSWHGLLPSAGCCECGMIAFHREQSAQLVAAVDDAGRTVLVPDDRPRDTPRDEHEAPSLFNAPRTMRGQTSMEGIE